MSFVIAAFTFGLAVGLNPGPLGVFLPGKVYRCATISYLGLSFSDKSSIDDDFQNQAEVA
jgi:hypothetical protein